MSNWTDTEITKRLGIPYPIIQGPFGRGGSSALLAATVSNAGGLGSYGANDQAPSDTQRFIPKGLSVNLRISAAILRMSVGV